MRLCTYIAGTRAAVGIVSEDGEHVHPLAKLWPDASRVPAPASMLDLIEGGAELTSEVRAAGGRMRHAAAGTPIASVKLLAPVTRPSKIICLALNNSANADRIMSGPKHPAMFLKPASALIGAGADIECRPEYGRTHPEPELAVIIGRGGKDIRAEDAYDHVFGYTIHNDITGATMRGEDTFHYRAIHPKSAESNEIEYVDTWTSYPGRYKGSDTFACMGPWLVTSDEIPDPHALDISCSHKGRLVTSDNTANLSFKTPEVIAFVSRYMTLWPGDIISLGTALRKSGGGGAVQNIDLLRTGGPVSVTIERIGTLANGVAVIGETLPSPAALEAAP
jgi:2-keto-4-pentenoate hydratase/2-oxohepta-3-ene-1,7-dioic acid hydratase in catechol pathway